MPDGPPDLPHVPQLILRQDRALIRAGAASTRYVLATCNAPEAPASNSRLPVNLALVLDRSGSMGAERKFPLAHLAAEQALSMLRPQDRFTLVVFDDRVDVLVPSVSASTESRRDALRLLGDVEPRGGTDLCAGWMAGAEQVRPFVSPERVSRVLLLTDGQANAGTVDPGELVGLASALRERGVSTTTFGVGQDYEERLLEAMAFEGGGNSYYVEGASQLTDFLTSETGEALTVVARGAVLEIEPPAGGRVSVLSRYRHRRNGSDARIRVELGDLVSGQEAQVVLQVDFPTGDDGTTSTMTATFTGDGALVAREERTVEWTYADHPANDRQPRDREVDRAVAAIFAARARAEATEANRRGDYRAAERVLRRTAGRIMSYANGDSVLIAEADRLAQDEATFQHAMSASEMKIAYQSANASWKGRAEDGRARRR